MFGVGWRHVSHSDANRFVPKFGGSTQLVAHANHFYMDDEGFKIQPQSMVGCF